MEQLAQLSLADELPVSTAVFKKMFREKEHDDDFDDAVNGDGQLVDGADDSLSDWFESTLM